ncbi:MAG: M6 family metalloprotease domain-containing protein, partial [Candidatus Zixiibacteriota bacterium]
MKRLLSYMLMFCSALIVLPDPAPAVGPQPALRDKINSGEVEPPPFLKEIDENHRKGICVGDSHNAIKSALSAVRPALAPGSGPQLAPTTIFRALAVLVDFSDNVKSVNAQFFDTLLFTAQSGTVRDYYSEISYGQLDMVSVNLPSSLGWQRAPQTYAYYVNGQNGTGAYPNNSQKLTEDVVDLIDPLVDFSQYDNDGNGTVDVLVIVHSGSGAEFTGSANDIWSHKWAISPRLKDGVTISDYTVQPEFWINPGDMTIGVYAHELGHGFGLPDLYDTDNSSWGLGRWSLMASGSWNGPTSFGESPAHPDP